ncbi:MAG: DUF2905 domain-containing protein [Campylobacterota bacterium]|nr:DUF2905 domain-containing protein [Campylobacterota bacterium]
MSTGNWLIGAGAVLILIGLAYKCGLLNWFGNLPGDIKYEGENRKFYFPIVTMIVISIVLSLLFSFFKK